LDFGLPAAGLRLSKSLAGILDWGWEMDERAFKERTKRAELRVIKVIGALPSGKTADVLGRQLLRSGTSVGANYRAACRGKSPADAIAKLAIVEEEADETIYWLELLSEAGVLPAKSLSELIDEFNQITAMTVASQKTLRGRIPKSKTRNLS
jgi:four helix bundle protein